MKISFIACEYNPFHNGHMYHIRETKANFSDAVVCIMSGNFVQRGDIAVCEKHIRAKQAILSGADLVIELPAKYATSTASWFADGFVRTAKATGLDCSFSFGAGCELDKLREISSILHSDKAEAFAYENKNISYPEAKQMFAEKMLGKENAALLRDPNNILAFEYLRSINKYTPLSDVYCVHRKGPLHDSIETIEGFASASRIRDIIYNFLEDGACLKSLFACEKFIPEKAFEALLMAYSSGLFPVDKSKFSLTAMSVLSTKDSDAFSKINSVNGGLENKLAKEIRGTYDIYTLSDNVKSKRYPHSRIRQILIQSLLGITKDMLEEDIKYLRVLAFNDCGREILHSIKVKAQVPVIMNLSEADKCDSSVAREAEIDYFSGKLINMCSPCPRDGNPEYDIPPVYIKSVEI